jgi:hypothetical protein
MTQRPLTFVVGTGRTGSTLLSRILRLHPEILSVNELFSSMDGAETHLDRPLTGAQFWKTLAAPHARINAMIANGTLFPELLYPQVTGGRFSPMEIPALCLMVLPHLTDDPDALFDELAVEISAWPERPEAQQYEAMFDALATRFGRRVVVERSGHSLQRVPYLREAFPRAKFVHMFRDGPDCALSMSRHPGFRMMVLAREISETTGTTAVSELTPEQLRLLPPDLAALITTGDPNAVRDRVIPLTSFGTLWSDSILLGLQHLAAVPGHMSLRYEDLLSAPDSELTRLADFLGVRPDPQWLRTGGQMLEDRRGAAMSLPPDELSALREHCDPGTSALVSRG